MPDYRLFPVKKDGHIIGPPAIVSVEHDGDAVREAKKRLNGNGIEVWQGNRRIAILSPHDRG